VCGGGAGGGGAPAWSFHGQRQSWDAVGFLVGWGERVTPNREGGVLGPMLHMLVSHVSPLLPELDSECYSKPELPATRTG
jgi:hypothetical protein